MHELERVWLHALGGALLLIMGLGMERCSNLETRLSEIEKHGAPTIQKQIDRMQKRIERLDKRVEGSR